jgi:hypothetical protein
MGFPCKPWVPVFFFHGFPHVYWQTQGKWSFCSFQVSEAKTHSRLPGIPKNRTKYHCCSWLIFEFEMVREILEGQVSCTLVHVSRGCAPFQ